MKNDKPPNIIFLMSDDHQAFAMGCMGNQEIETPNMDVLAEDGMIFDNCYAASPLCMPSRATVFTGLHEYRHGVNFRPNSKFPTGKMARETWNRYSYAARLRSNGYRTAFAGKWGFPFDQPDYSTEFDAWGGYAGHGQGNYDTARNATIAEYAKDYPHETRALAAFGRDFIRSSVESSQPFCLSISFKAPHAPHNQIDPEDQERYAGQSFTKRSNWGRDKAELLPIQPKLGRQYWLFKEWEHTIYGDHIRAYYQLISGIDAALGMLREELEKQGIADNTIVIYTSDNGYYCGSHGLGGKVLPHEESARIPLIIYDPRMKTAGKQKRCRRAVSTIDYAPTIMEMAGLEPENDADGRTLVPLLENPEAEFRRSLPLVYNWGWAENDHNRGMAVVTEECKYIFWCYGDHNMEPAEELYGLRKDPFELNNLANDPDSEALLEDMRRLYDAHHRELSEKCVEGEDYQRLIKLFDRHVSWREKDYRSFRFAEDKCNGAKFFPYSEERSEKSCIILENIYRQLTGEEPS